MRIRYKLLTPTALPPAKMTKNSVGWDLSADLKHPEILEPGDRAAIPTGIAVEIPEGYEGQIRPRSGLALHRGLGVLNSPGTIDSDYRGEISIIVINSSAEVLTIQPTMRIAQLVICPVVKVTFEESEALEDSERSQGGFGHTGE
jgi:dUTP pyrophosphatase